MNNKEGIGKEKITEGFLIEEGFSLTKVYPSYLRWDNGIFSINEQFGVYYGIKKQGTIPLNNKSDFFAYRIIRSIEKNK